MPPAKQIEEEDRPHPGSLPARSGERSIAAIAWLILAIACGLPLVWLGVQIVTNPHVLADAIPDRFRWGLIARTFGFDALAATLGTLLAIPVGIAIGIGRGIWARLLGLLVCVPLLMPSLVMTYGWKQVYARLGYDPMPQSKADIARCIIALSSWVWPVPAMTLAFALRRVDPNVLLHARLDGVAGRILARLVAGPLLIGFLAAMLLSLQEFAIFEPSGISVIATEVRAVFETGSSLDQRWTILADSPDRHGPPQAARMGAALAVMLPGLIGTALLGMVGWKSARGLSDGMEWNVSDRSNIGASRLGGFTTGAYAIVALMVGAPIVAMVRSMRVVFDPLKIANEYAPQIIGSMTLAAIAGTVGVVLIVIASAVRISRGATLLALASFLIGGQWTAIALIVVFNRPWLLPLYDSIAMPVIAYVGRFAWIALIAASLTWSPGTRWLRDLAATDGADRSATWRYVIAPLAWPLLLGAALLISTLSLTEVPATTLLQPAQTLVPMLMTWAHILNYDAMIEASLLLAIVVLAAGVSVALLIRTGRRWMR